MFWCGCRGKKKEKVAQPKEAKAQQERGVVERRSGEPSKY